MDLGLDGKVALLAASSRGIGRAAALRLSEEGAAVGICARGPDDLQETVDACPGPSLGVEADVRDPDDLTTFVEDVLETFGGIDILVNNAGGPPSGGFQETDPEGFREAVELNLMSMIELTKRALPHLKQSEWGRIINITSVSAKEPVEELVLSNTTRPGVLGAAKTLSRELAEENVTVNSVLPGLTGTDRMKELTEDAANRLDIDVEAAREATLEEVPMNRWARPEEIADVIVFLASERASFVTGTAVPVDGGSIRSLV